MFIISPPSDWPKPRRLVTFGVGNTGVRVSLGPCQTFLESRWASENNFQAARHSPGTPKQRLQPPGVQAPQLGAKFKDVYRKWWTPEAARMVLSRRLAEPVMGRPKGSPSSLTCCLTLTQARLTASPSRHTHHSISQTGLLRLRKVKAFTLQGYAATEWKPGGLTGLLPLLTMAPYSLPLKKVTDTNSRGGKFRFLWIKSQPSYGIT